MTIKKFTGPANGFEVISQAVARRFPAFAALGSPLGGNKEIAPPVPYYHLGLEALNDPAPLSRAKHTGWRFTVLNGREVTLAKLGNAPNDVTAPAFEGLLKGKLAQRYVEAIHFAENRFGPLQTQVEYEPRLLDVPALHFVTLWLKGSHDIFIPLLDGVSAESGELALEQDILPLLRRREALLRGTSPLGGRSHTTPTN